MNRGTLKHSNATDDGDRYYRESGIVPVFAIPLMLIAAIATALLTSPLIALASTFCGGCAALGVVFGIGLLVPAFHSILIGTVIKGVARLCSVRRRSMVTAVWFVSVLIAFYLFLHAHVWFHTGAGQDRFLVLLQPTNLIQEMIDGLAQLPTVSVVVILVFLFIFLCLYLLPLVIVENDDSHPYCEECNCFTICHPKEVEFKFLTTHAFENWDFAALKQFSPHGATTQFFRAKMYLCPKCEESCYIRVWQIDRWPDIEKGPKDTDTVKLSVDLLKVPIKLRATFDASNPS